MPDNDSKRKPRIIVTMQSGKEFDLDGQRAVKIKDALHSLKSHPITVEYPDGEVTIVPAYVECFVFYPNGNVDTTLLRPILLQPISDLEPLMKKSLGRRATNVFRVLELETIGDLVNITEQELRWTPNLGVKSITEIKQALAHYGLELSQ